MCKIYTVTNLLAAPGCLIRHSAAIKGWRTRKINRAVLSAQRSAAGKKAASTRRWNYLLGTI